MRAPDTKKPKHRRSVHPQVFQMTQLPPPTLPGEMGSPRVLLSASLTAASQSQLREALKVLKVLKPSPAKREIWREKIHQALAFRELHWNDHVEVDERGPGGPPNTRARDAAELARGVLEKCDLELTTERKGVWHLLTQIFAGSKRDLRHHLKNSLAEKPAR